MFSKNRQRYKKKRREKKRKETNQKNSLFCFETKKRRQKKKKGKKPKNSLFCFKESSQCSQGFMNFLGALGQKIPDMEKFDKFRGGQYQGIAWYTKFRQKIECKSFLSSSFRFIFLFFSFFSFGFLSSFFTLLPRNSFSVFVVPISPFHVFFVIFLFISLFFLLSLTFLDIFHVAPYLDADLQRQFVGNDRVCFFNSLSLLFFCLFHSSQGKSSRTREFDPFPFLSFCSLPPTLSLLSHFLSRF